MTLPSRVTAPAVDALTVQQITTALRTHRLTLRQTDLLVSVLCRMGTAVIQTGISERNWFGLPTYIALDTAEAFHTAPDSPAKAYLELLGTVKQ